MTFASPGPIFIDLGPLVVRWYGLLIAMAFISAIEIAKFLQKIRKADEKELLDPDKYSTFAFIAMISGIIGARLWFVVLSFDYFKDHLLEAPAIWLGGISIQGGLLGAAIGTYIFCKTNMNKYSYFLALTATAMPFAQALGRWGNFFNEEAFGQITNLPWKLYISHTGNYHHPTFLYESAWNILVFFILVWMNFKMANKGYKRSDNYALIGSYLALYSFGRFLIEPIRTDSLTIAGVPAASILAILGIAIGLAVILWNKRKSAQA